MPFDETPMRENVVMGIAEARGAAATAARAPNDWRRVNIMILLLFGCSEKRRERLVLKAWNQAKE